MAEKESNPGTEGWEENECEDDYDIDFCDETDIDDDGDISTQEDTHSNPVISVKAEQDSSTNSKVETGSGANTNNTNMYSFRILDIEVVYKLCSTTVLFKTETILKLIQVCMNKHQRILSILVMKLPNRLMRIYLFI